MSLLCLHPRLCLPNSPSLPMGLPPLWLRMCACQTMHCLALLPSPPTTACLPSISSSATTAFRAVTAARAVHQQLGPDPEPPAHRSLMVPHLLQDQVCVSLVFRAWHHWAHPPATATSPMAPKQTLPSNPTAGSSGQQSMWLPSAFTTCQPFRILYTFLCFS